MTRAYAPGGRTTPSSAPRYPSTLAAGAEPRVFVTAIQAALRLPRLGARQVQSAARAAHQLARRRGLRRACFTVHRAQGAADRPDRDDHEDDEKNEAHGAHYPTGWETPRAMRRNNNQREIGRGDWI